MSATAVAGTDGGFLQKDQPLLRDRVAPRNPATRPDGGRNREADRGRSEDRRSSAAPSSAETPERNHALVLIRILKGSARVASLALCTQRSNHVNRVAAGLSSAATYSGAAVLAGCKVHKVAVVRQEHGKGPSGVVAGLIGSGPTAGRMQPLDKCVPLPKTE